MKVEAYCCDFCHEVKVAAEMVGVSPKQDLFEVLKSFEIDYHPHRQPVHLCTKCYDMNVVQPTERETNRKKNEHAYILKLNEMSYLVRAQCVTNYNKEIQKNIRKKV